MTRDLQGFDDAFAPAPANANRAEDITDGTYLFEILAARFKRPKDNNVLELTLVVLSPGPHEGASVQHSLFINNQESAARVGRDLATLGFDTDQWKPANGRPFSAEFDKALKLLPGLRWKGTKKTSKSGEKVYHNIFIDERADGDGRPAHFGPDELNAATNSGDPFGN
jgi:hypothetical protein